MFLHSFNDIYESEKHLGDCEEILGIVTEKDNIRNSDDNKPNISDGESEPEDRNDGD